MSEHDRVSHEANAPGETGRQGQAPPQPVPPSQREQAPVSDTTEAELNPTPANDPGGTREGEDESTQRG